MMWRCALARNNWWYICTVKKPNNAAGVVRILKPEKISVMSNTTQKGIKISTKKK